MAIAALLEPYQRFGVNLGLSRIHELLEKLDNPQRKVPYVHVGGTNGKGSVCAYLSAVLTEAGYTVGRYTSPHLIDWNERVCLNDQPLDSGIFETALQQVIDLAPPQQEDSPTLFEVFTAAVWLCFAELPVDIAVMEVGLGGRLDATNVKEPCLLSIITSLSREHWQVLGPTVADIAKEKAGILKPDRPVFLGNIPPAAKPVFQGRIEELKCPDQWIAPASKLDQIDVNGYGLAEFRQLKYPFALLGEFQLQNNAFAIAALQELQNQGWSKITPEVIQSGMAKARWPGRLQWVTYQDQKILLDGAHNPAAAEALATFVNSLRSPANPSVTWVMGMLSTKEHDQIFQHLLHSGDRLLLVPVPDHSSADLGTLATLAQQICPDLGTIQTYNDCFEALQTLSKTNSETLTVLCGSLYLVGHFLEKTIALS
ncbi:MAG: bifunctional folylpolyglutamate synthase/dihydrofolate synthase [Synechocystis sp.]